MRIGLSFGKIHFLEGLPLGFSYICPNMEQEGKTDIRNLSEAQLRDFFVGRSLGAYRGGQVHKWLWQKGADTFAQMTDLPKAVRAALEQEFYIGKIASVASQYSADGTIKNAVRLSSGVVVESVVIPAEDRTTVCVSCQSGCRMGCAFCATGRMRQVQDLSAGEIYDQVVLADAQSRERFLRPVSNIVFMGMGEPTANYDEVMRAIGMITSPDGLGMSPKRITVSTAGNARMIRRMADAGAKLHLAVSLHFADQHTRAAVMPVARAFPLEELAAAATYWYAKTRDRVTYEYIVWAGVNDTRADAEALVRFCRRAPSKVNLIEYNSIGDDRFLSAGPVAMQMYVDVLESAGITVVVRYSKGRDIDAACGQLAGREKAE